MNRLFICYDTTGAMHHVIALTKYQARKQLLNKGKIAVFIKTLAYVNTRSFNQQELLIIIKQLSTLLKATLPLVDSLSLLAKEQTKMYCRYVITDIKDRVMRGTPLSEVMAHYPAIFSTLLREIVAVGELTGNLAQSLECIAEQMEKAIRLNKKIKQSLRYPLFLLISSAVVMLVMLLVVLPKFASIYDSFNSPLPYFTQIVLNVSQHLYQYGLLLIIMGIMILCGYFFLIKPRMQLSIDRAKLAIPCLGKLFQTACLARIFQTLAMTQQSAIPLLSGLYAVEKIINNAYYKNTLSTIIKDIKNGNALSDTIRAYHHFPPICSQLILAGEESSTLDNMLNQLAIYFQEQNDDMAQSFTQQFEPILMCVLSILIGALIFAIYLPIFKLGDVIY